MARKTVGVLTIGQSPRPDLVSPLLNRLPPGCRLIEAGALDGLSRSEIPKPDAAAYPLSTRLREGKVVMVGERFLADRLQQALGRLEAQGVVATALLCAGTFAQLAGTRPLFKPYEIGVDELLRQGWRAIGLITPIQPQEDPIRQRWARAGFRPTVWTADLARQDDLFRERLRQRIARHNLECLVLDYVGHSATSVIQLREHAQVPVVDLGQLVLAAIVAAVSERGDDEEHLNM